MPGLLDNPLLKLLLSGSPYMQQREKTRIQDSRADEAEGLMSSLYGSVGDPTAMAYEAQIQPTTETYDANTGQTHITGGEMMQGAGVPQGMEGGSGLLGNQLTPEQFNAQLNTGLAGIYGADGLMQSRSITEMQNAGAMARTKYQNMIPGYAQIQATKNKLFDQVEALQTKFQKATVPQQATIRGATAMDRLFPTEASYAQASGSTQLAGIMRFMKQQNDGGSFMSDDMQNIARAGGAQGMVSDMWNWFISTGFKDPKVMKDLHMTMRTAANADSTQIKGQLESLSAGIPWLTQQHLKQIGRGEGLNYAMPVNTQTKVTTDTSNIVWD